MKEFKGKTALITGAAYGFGKEFVKQAAKRGMKIVAVDRVPSVTLSSVRYPSIF